MEVENYAGLSEEEAAKRKKQYGGNVLIPEKKTTLLKKILGFVKEPMLLLLFAAAALYFVLGEALEGLVMLVFVAFVAAINAFQEYRTDQTLRALKDLSAPKVTAVRGGRQISLPSEDLVPGDIIVLSEGEKIPADGRVLSCHDLGVNQSALTGEPETVWKRECPEDGPASPDSMLFAGCMVVQGGAVMEVLKTGAQTEFGKIGKAVSEAPDRPTPLEKTTRKLVKAMAFFSLAMFAAVLAATFLESGDIIGSLLSGVTLMMALIPEEFPVILAVFLAAGASRLARHQALIRRIPSVETLGCVSVLCVDKTGTLTENRMTLKEILPCAGASWEKTARIAAWACELAPYDPMEKEILKAAPAREGALIHEYSLDPELKLMGHVWETEEGRLLCVKGAPEGVLSLCGCGVPEEVRRMAEHGYRVLAIACRVLEGDIPSSLRETHLEFVGLAAFEDPVREGIEKEIAACREAGIRVVMITGDMEATARAYALKAGIANSGVSMTGDEIDTADDAELMRRLKDTNVFARVRPEQKLRIVQAFRQLGEITAMTGDGVNDAPALKYADIGIAMGDGSGVAREAADMVLLDNSFSAIVRTVRDGRRIFDNIKKAFAYVATVHIPIALIALLTPLLKLPLILWPTHVVLLELIIDPTCSIVFERLPDERDIMQRPPRDPKAPIITARTFAFAVLNGLLIAAFVFIPYLMMQPGGLMAGFQAYANTFAFVNLVAANLFIVYCSRSYEMSTLTAIVRNRDKTLWLITAGVLVALCVCVYAPFMHPLINTVALPPAMLIAAVITGLMPSLIADIMKAVRKILKKLRVIR